MQTWFWFSVGVDGVCEGNGMKEEKGDPELVLTRTRLSRASKTELYPQGSSMSYLPVLIRYDCTTQIEMSTLTDIVYRNQARFIQGRD